MTDATTLPRAEGRPALTAEDRCDRCGAQAYLRAVLPGGGELLFCGHHAAAHEDRIREMAVEVDDERDRIPA